MNIKTLGVAIIALASLHSSPVEAEYVQIHHRRFPQTANVIDKEKRRFRDSNAFNRYQYQQPIRNLSRTGRYHGLDRFRRYGFNYGGGFRRPFGNSFRYGRRGFGRRCW